MGKIEREFHVSSVCTDSCNRAAWIFGNTHRLISQNSCTCTSVCVRERETYRWGICHCSSVCGGTFACEISYIFGNTEWSVFTFLYAQFISGACGLLYFKFPPTWPKPLVSTMLLLIQSMILTDILKLHTSNGMFVVMLPIADVCQ